MMLKKKRTKEAKKQKKTKTAKKPSKAKAKAKTKMKATPAVEAKPVFRYLLNPGREKLTEVEMMILHCAAQAKLTKEQWDEVLQKVGVSFA